MNNTSTNNMYESFSSVNPTTYQRTVISCFEVASFCLGILSVLVNTASLGAMYFMRGERTAYIRFLRNLNVTDLLASLTFLLIQNVSIKSKHVSSIFLSYIFRSLPWMFLTAYLLTLLSLATNQYLAVCKPWRYSGMVTAPRVTVAIAVIWIISALQIIVPLIIVSLLSMIKHENVTEVMAHVSTVEMQVWMGLFTLIIVGDVCLNVLVYKQISLLKRRLAHRQDSETIRSKQRAFLTLTYLMLTGVFFWFPFPLVGISGMNFTLTRDIFTWKLLNGVISVLLYLNCLIDPLIYVARMKEIRSAYKKMLLSCKAMYLDRFDRGTARPVTTTVESTHHQHEQINMLNHNDCDSL